MLDQRTMLLMPTLIAANSILRYALLVSQPKDLMISASLSIKSALDKE